MSERAALVVSVLSLALFGVGPCHALSLRSLAAEICLGEVRPGMIAVVGANGTFSVENPPPEMLKDESDPPPDMRKRIDAKDPGRPFKPGEKSELANAGEPELVVRATPVRACDEWVGPGEVTEAPFVRMQDEAEDRIRRTRPRSWMRMQLLEFRARAEVLAMRVSGSILSYDGVLNRRKGEAK